MRRCCTQACAHGAPLSVDCSRPSGRARRAAAGPSGNGASAPRDASAGRQHPDVDSTDWGQSIPSYLQSTSATDVCDDWSEAIDQAEAAAAARNEAAKAGKAPPSPAASKRPRSEFAWSRIRAEVTQDIEKEPILSSFLFTSVLSHRSFAEALAFVLSNRISDQTLLPTQLFSLFLSLTQSHPHLLQCAAADLEAVYDRDPACMTYSQALLYFKGYHAIQLYRFSHELWAAGRKAMALSLQSRLSEVLAVDIHPAARFGKGILLDHGTGLVIGETAVIGNGVSLMQNVTLGGTGKDIGDRHPKVEANVLIGCGASVLGNITVGTGAQIAAGSLVLKPVEAHTMVAGSPARPVGLVRGNPAEDLAQWRPEASYDMADESVLVRGDERRRRAAATVTTAAGTRVRQYDEADFDRHLDAERQLLNAAARPAAAGAPEREVVVFSESEGEDHDAGAEVASGAELRKVLVGVGGVDAAMSDAEAEDKWGSDPPDPEFFI